MFRRRSLPFCSLLLLFNLIYLSSLVVAPDPAWTSSVTDDHQPLHKEEHPPRYASSEQAPDFLQGLTKGDCGADKKHHDPAGPVNNCYCYMNMEGVHDKFTIFSMRTWDEAKKADMIKDGCKKISQHEFGRGNYTEEVEFKLRDLHHVTARYNRDFDACKDPVKLSQKDFVGNVTEAVTWSVRSQVLRFVHFLTLS